MAQGDFGKRRQTECYPSGQRGGRYVLTLVPTYNGKSRFAPAGSHWPEVPTRWRWVRDERGVQRGVVVSQ